MSTHAFILDALTKHFEAKPSKLWKPSGDSVGVARFSAKDTGRPWDTLSTYGMSLNRMTLDDRAVETDTARSEVVLYAAEGSKVDDAVRWLSWAGSFPFLQDEPTFIGWGHTVRMGPVVEGSELTTLFFLNPLVRPDKGTIFSIGDDAVSLLWLTFLSDAEHVVSKEDGPNAVLDLFGENDHPIEFDFSRTSYR